MTASTLAAGPDPVVRKVRNRLVLPCALFLLFSTIDRTNVSFAADAMSRSLGMDHAQYGFGAGIFFVGYLLGQVPSILLLERFGFRRWLCGIALLWGACAAAMAFIDSLGQFYALRVLLGLAEAGLAPGIVVYLSRWSDDRGRASLIAIPLAAIPLSVAIAGPLSGVLLQMENPVGMENWRWMLLIEGIPTILIALAALAYFPDRPSEAHWLSDREKAFIANITTAPTSRPAGAAGVWGLLTNARVWICGALWFCLMAGNYGVIFWLPQVVSGLSGFSPFWVGVIVALPWIANIVGILTVARHSDRTGERFIHIAIPCFVSAVAVLAAFASGATLLGLVSLIILGLALGSCLGPYWAVPLRLLPPEQRAIGTTIINIIGGLAGLLIPIAFGAIRQITGTFTLPTFLLALLVASGGVLALIARRLDRPVDGP